MLVDLNDVVKPKLQIMDAIVGMEGDGPFAGDPRKIGAVMASGDYSAIDVATCRLIAVDPVYAPTIAAAVERGYLREDLSDVSMIGDSLEDLNVKDFKRPATYAGQGRRHDPSSPFAKIMALASEYTLRPVIHEDLCTACLKCVMSCPVKTISVVDEKPVIDYTKCIRCYCCHEMCDSRAISLEHNEAAGKELAKLTGT
jgi:Pyruvate/2-oxoacid:ferredoxin oxidoreductase delta subunit